MTRGELYDKQEVELHEKQDWRAVTSDMQTHRMRVPGGWLYRLEYAGQLRIQFLPLLKE